MSKILYEVKCNAVYWTSLICSDSNVSGIDDDDPDQSDNVSSQTLFG